MRPLPGQFAAREATSPMRNPEPAGGLQPAVRHGAVPRLPEPAVGLGARDVSL
jgi:hypothetical protein